MQLPEKKSEWVRCGVIAAVVAARLLVHLAPVRVARPGEAAAATSPTRFGAWTYLLAGLLAFLETGAFVGLVVPGETFVILAGAVAGQGATDIYITIADRLVLRLGRRHDQLLHRAAARPGVHPAPRAEAADHRGALRAGGGATSSSHGGKTILIGRFIGLVRALAPFVAGSSGMEYRAFVPYSVLGTGLWAATFSLLGYFGSRSINEIADVGGHGITLFGITVAVIVAIVVVGSVPARGGEPAAGRSRGWTGGRGCDRWSRSGRRVKPQARFLWNRITPGDLGLELTAMLAALSVSRVRRSSATPGSSRPTRARRRATRRRSTMWRLTSRRDG